MKISFLAFLTVFALTTQILEADVPDNSCANNARVKLAADTLSRILTREIGILPGGLNGFKSLTVTDVGPAGTPCSSAKWAKRALGLPVPDFGEFDTCGIVYSFTDEAAFRAFAKSSIALKSSGFIMQSLVKEGHTETFYVPVCAVLKND